MSSPDVNNRCHHISPVRSAQTGFGTLVLGDSIELLRAGYAMPEPLDLVVTDPPLNTRKHEWDKFADFGGFTRTWLELTRRRMATTGTMFVMWPWTGAPEGFKLFEPTFWPVWIGDPGGVFPTAIYDNRLTVIFDIRMDRRRATGQLASSVLSFPEARGGGAADTKIHPFQKPVLLVAYLIELATKPGDLVFDPFAGSATTAHACEMTRRRWVCYEKESDHWMAGVQRLRNAGIEVVETTGNGSAHSSQEVRHA